MEDRDDCVGEDLAGTRADVAVSDRCGLEAVQLVESAVDRGIRDEVVDVVIFGRDSRLVADEG